MGLESATLIHELDPSNPVGGSDPKSQGDDHIRMFKAAVQNTLPNVEGVVTASHTELNILDGATLSTAELNVLDGLTATQTQLNLLGSQQGNQRIAFGTFNSGTNNACLDNTWSNKNITGVTHANSSGSYTIDYTAAGFTKKPNIQVTLQNQSVAGLRVNTVFGPTTTSVTINIQNNSGVASDAEFYFFAQGE
jgi:hypothetical protein